MSAIRQLDVVLQALLALLSGALLLSDAAAVAGSERRRMCSAAIRMGIPTENCSPTGVQRQSCMAVYFQHIGVDPTAFHVSMFEEQMAEHGIDEPMIMNGSRRDDVARVLTVPEYHCNLWRCMHKDNILCRAFPACLHGGQCRANRTQKKFFCHCPPGYTGFSCEEDIDECASGSHSCNSTLICTNSPGSYNCKPSGDFDTALVSETHKLARLVEKLQTRIANYRRRGGRRKNGKRAKSRSGILKKVQQLALVTERLARLGFAEEGRASIVDNSSGLPAEHPQVPTPRMTTTTSSRTATTSSPGAPLRPKRSPAAETMTAFCNGSPAEPQDSGLEFQ